MSSQNQNCMTCAKTALTALPLAGANREFIDFITQRTAMCRYRKKSIRVSALMDFLSPLAAMAPVTTIILTLLVFLSPFAAMAMVTTTEGEALDCVTTIRVPIRVNNGTDWVSREVAMTVAQVFPAACQSTPPPPSAGAPTLSGPGDTVWGVVNDYNQISIFASDPQGQTLTWKRDFPLPPGLGDSNMSNEELQIYGRPTTPGVYTAGYTVTDPDGNSGSITLQITVDPENGGDTPSPPAGAPTLTGPGDTTWGKVNNYNQISIFASDPEGQTLTWTRDFPLPPGLGDSNMSNEEMQIYGRPTTPGVYTAGYTVTDPDGNSTSISLQITIDPENGGGAPPPPPSNGFTQVRSNIPATPPLNGLYPPMSANGGERWEFMKSQYAEWFHTCAPSNHGNGARGGDTRECWRYDPMKTLYEFAERGELVGEPQPAALADAQATAQEFLDRQYWGTSGGYPDCSGGVPDITGVDKCDMKHWGHASAALYRHKADGHPYAYDDDKVALMKQYCFEQGWGAGFVNVDDLADLYTERWTGLAIQCLVDLHKVGVDVSEELAVAIDYQHAMFTGDYSGQAIGAPMHSMNAHECSGYCPDMDYWMFSPWMGASFLIPALWEYWVFVDKDPRIAQMIVLYGDALMNHGVVEPDAWTQDARDPQEWMISENPTPWLTLYFGNPYDLEQAIADQDGDGWFSDLHNPESIFALSAAYFFSCNQDFRNRVDEMWPFFNQSNATDNGSPLRIFLWQHRGSASTEWLLENAACQ